MKVYIYRYIYIIYLRRNIHQLVVDRIGSDQVGIGRMERPQGEDDEMTTE